MTHRQMTKRVVEAQIRRMSPEKKAQLLYSYMMDDFGECDMEELEDYLKTYTRK